MNERHFNVDEIEEMRNHKFEPSKYFLDFHIAGFTYYDGLDVIEELTLGKSVDLVVEPDNPYDPEAVAIFYQNKKLGYIPKDRNTMISKILYFGHGDIFEAKIQFADKEQNPERQFRVVVKLKDKRK
ncbi:HIRAN domain-containing protein [Sporolactobacillus putidus]|uniref:Restriction endonuclease n=1 Tax=Sporolactobacillus putidus TaxID=492735 RepID=A0A917VZI6_9BACL|nr:HIRAN domain-containing protein [Sporolactobacillus putidus]GGL43448.1 restriction endonuclease [Sporolactobacillus putidus]